MSYIGNKKQVALYDAYTREQSDGNYAEISRSRKNLIINGNFDIWQRAISQTIAGYGSDDRWHNSNIGSTKTHTQESFALGQLDVPNNPRYYSRTVVTSVAGVSNYVAKHQRVEDVRALAGKTVTLSFYAKADAAKNISIDFRQNFGNGGTPSASVEGIGAQQITLSTTFQRYEITVNIPSISGKTIGTDDNDFLGLTFWFDAGSNFNARTASLGQQSGTFDIAQVQLEDGSIATDFDRRSVAEEVELCQRYFQSYEFVGAPGVNGRTPVSLTTRMRITPSVSVSMLSGGGTTDFVNGSDIILLFQQSGGSNYANFEFTADAEL